MIFDRNNVSPLAFNYTLMTKLRDELKELKQNLQIDTNSLAGKFQVIYYCYKKFCASCRFNIEYSSVIDQLVFVNSFNENKGKRTEYGDFFPKKEDLSKSNDDGPFDVNCYEAAFMFLYIIDEICNFTNLPKTIYDANGKVSDFSQSVDGHLSISISLGEYEISIDPIASFLSEDNFIRERFQHNSSFLISGRESLIPYDEIIIDGKDIFSLIESVDNYIINDADFYRESDSLVYSFLSEKSESQKKTFLSFFGKKNKKSIEELQEFLQMNYDSLLDLNVLDYFNFFKIYFGDDAKVYLVNDVTQENYVLVCMNNNYYLYDGKTSNIELLSSLEENTYFSVATGEDIYSKCLNY